MSGMDAVSETLLCVVCSAMESTRDCNEMCRDLYVELWVASCSSRPSMVVLESSEGVAGSGEEYMVAGQCCKTYVRPLINQCDEMALTVKGISRVERPKVW